MNKLIQTKNYEAPKVEVIETVSTAVLCISTDTSATMMDLNVVGGGWTVQNGTATGG